jgi:uncharacterized membrane protein
VDTERRNIGLKSLDIKQWQKIISFIGLIDSIYLIIIKFANNRALCLQGVGDCYDVNSSSYSVIFGIPIAILGAGAYLTLLVILFLETRNVFFERNGSILVFGITLAGTLYSIYLTYIEVAVLRAICPFCVISAISMLSLFIISTARLISSSGE